MPNRADIVITGLGVVSPIGKSPGEFWAKLFSGFTGVRPITRFDSSRFSCRLAAEVDGNCEVETHEPMAYEIKRMDRFVRYAAIAGRSALEQSGLIVSSSDSGQGGVFVGVGMGGLPHVEAGILRQEKLGVRKTTPYLIPSLIPGMGGGLLSLALRIRGPQYTFASACSAGTQALGEALWAIRSQRISWALAGGTEAVITPITFSGFGAMRALSCAASAEAAPRPFDRSRDGMIVGEGAAFFVLESRHGAEDRGAEIQAELRGYATITGTQGLVNHAAQDMRQCMQAALADSRLGPREVDVIFAQGSGLAQDERELMAIKETFAEGPGGPSITSIEGQIGHTFGASGPMSLLAAVGALQRGQVPGTRNLVEVTPGFEALDVAKECRPKNLRNAFVNTWGFGGVHASLVCSATQAIQPSAPVGVRTSL